MFILCVAHQSKTVNVPPTMKQSSATRRNAAIGTMTRQSFFASEMSDAGSVGYWTGGCPSLLPQEPQYSAPSDRNASQSGQSSLCSSPQNAQYLEPSARASPHLSHAMMSPQQPGDALGALDLHDDQEAFPVSRHIPDLRGDELLALLGHLAVSLDGVDERVPLESERLGGIG